MTPRSSQQTAWYLSAGSVGVLDLGNSRPARLKRIERCCIAYPKFPPQIKSQEKPRETSFLGEKLGLRGSQGPSRSTDAFLHDFSAGTLIVHLPDLLLSLVPHGNKRRCPSKVPAFGMEKARLCVPSCLGNMGRDWRRQMCACVCGCRVKMKARSRPLDLP